MTLETKFLPLGVDLTITDGHQISGYASLFDLRDQGGDVVARGAYAASLARLKDRDCKVKMLWQHDPAQPIGVWDEVREDGKGLFVKGRILIDVERGKEAAALIAAGAIDGLSIGYRTVKASKAADGGRQLAELDLWEVSLVTFPMLPSARVAAKSEDPEGDALRSLAATLRSVGAAMAQTPT